MPNKLLNELRDQLRHGLTPELRARIEEAVQAHRGETSGHADWGRLCEEAGWPGLAFRQFQLALRDDPHDTMAAFQLAQLHRERGEAGRAAALLEPLLAGQPAREDWLAVYLAVLAEEGAGPRARQALERAVQAGLDPTRARALAASVKATPEEEVPADEELEAADADLVRFQVLFAGREDVHARQWARNGGEVGYSPVSEPLTPAVVRNHLLGSYTVGVYPIRLDGTCTFFALDLDLDRAALEQARGQPAQARQLRDSLHEQGLRVLGALHDLGLQPLFEDSGYKGRHYWVFLERPESAELLHRLGRLFLAWLGSQLPRGLHLEFFPKQGETQGKGLGNLIKLPLGIHRRTGRRATLLDDRGQPLAHPLAALRQVSRLQRPALHGLIDRLKPLAQAVPAPSGAGAPTPGEKAAPTARPGGPPPPDLAPAWTEADFQTDPRLRHLLRSCPVLAELKRSVDENRRLSHEEQLVLIHTLGHVEGGPQAVNYLLGKCVDVAPEKFLGAQLRGNPVSCPSIRKKIGHVTRRVPCNCPFDFAPDRYPTPVLHLLTLPPPPPTPPAGATAGTDTETLARRFAVLEQRRKEIEGEYQELREALLRALRQLPGRALACTGGRYFLTDHEGQEVLRWEPDSPPAAPAPPPPAPGQ